MISAYDQTNPLSRGYESINTFVLIYKWKIDYGINDQWYQSVFDIVSASMRLHAIITNLNILWENFDINL